MKITKYFPFVLLVYHLIFAFIGYDYITENNGDASRYWFLATDLSTISWFEFFKPGTDVLKFITYPFVNYFNLPFLAGFILFSLIGYAGFYILWKLFRELAGDCRIGIWISMLLLLLPNAHFWTSIIGKEAVLFPLVSLFLLHLYRKRFSGWQLWVSILGIAIIRPHVGVIFLIIVAIYYLLVSKETSLGKIKKALLFTIILAVTAYCLLIIAKIESNPFERIAHLYNVHIYKLRSTATYVPLDRYSLWYKLVTFYFRPYPWETSGFYFQVVCWENFILLISSVAAFVILLFNFKKLKGNNLLWMMIVLFYLYGIMYVYAYANIGLILRTKSLIIPVLYTIFILIFSSSKFKSFSK